MPSLIQLSIISPLLHALVINTKNPLTSNHHLSTYPPIHASISSLPIHLSLPHPPIHLSIVPPLPNPPIIPMHPLCHFYHLTTYPLYPLPSPSLISTYAFFYPPTYPLYLHFPIHLKLCTLLSTYNYHLPTIHLSIISPLHPPVIST